MHLPRPHAVELRPALARLIARPRVAVSLLVLMLVVVPLGVVAHGRDDGRGQVRLIAGTPGVHTVRTLSTDADFGAGRSTAASSRGGTLALSGPVVRRSYLGRTYESGSWMSAWVTPGQGFTQLIPSWNALTPPGAWLQVLVQVRTRAGAVSGWKDLGRWSARDTTIKRVSAGAQTDPVATVATDTVKARTGVTLTGYRFTVRLMRTPGTVGPSLRSLAAVVSRMPTGTPATSTPVRRIAITLPVPSYSQMTHRGQNPEYGGGGEAWCSPTSLAMVLAYYRRLPAPAEYAWVRHRQGWVNHTARLTYDHAYEGAGNWAFSTAVGANRVGEGFVTRLPDLASAERFVRAGIPLVLSVKYGRGQLAGSPIASTPGHLLVLVGFTSTGRPVVNDPAAATDAGVRRSYDRAQFERAWQGGSGGVAYVIRDGAHPLPWRPPGTTAW